MACIVCGQRVGKSPSNSLKEMFCSKICAGEWRTLTHFVKVAWKLPKYSYERQKYNSSLAMVKTYFIK